MPGSTPRGFPYAQPADPLVQWPATSQALAEKVDALKAATEVLEAQTNARTRMVTGFTNMTGQTLEPNLVGQRKFDLPLPAGMFTSPPAIVATLVTGGSRHQLLLMVGGTSPTAAEIFVFNNSGESFTGDIQFYWIAMQGN